MSWNINSGYGRLLAERIGLGFGGKIFVVGKSAVAHRDIYQQIFAPDTNGVVRFFSTIDSAVNACTANAGDVIVVLPGHTETITGATDIVLDVAGINIVGLGQGSLRPSITYATNTTATIPVSAANVRISNIRLLSNLANVATAIDLSATYLTVEDCAFEAATVGSTSLGFLAVVTTDSTTDSCNGLTMRRCSYVDLVASVSSTFIKQNGTNSFWRIENNFIRLGVNNNTASLIAQATSKVNQAGLIKGNYVYRLNTDTATGAILITTDSSSNRSIICDNYVQHIDTAAELLVTASSGYGVFNNYASGVQGASGYLLPAADS